MKRFLLPISLALALGFLPLAHSQTDAMPPEKMADRGDMHHEKAPVPPSKFLVVTFQGRVTTLSVDDLLGMPQVTVHVHNAHSNKDEEYTGPSVTDVLAKAGLSASKETEPLILHSSVVATGTDKYFVLYSAAEMETSFSTGKVIIAVMKNGLPNTGGGVIQLVNTVDAKPARWVHGLSNLTVMGMTQK